jgi:formylglycine-generating enzyme required for sulfatase activity
MKRHLPIFFSTAALLFAAWWAISTLDGADEAGGRRGPTLPPPASAAGPAGDDAARPPTLAAGAPAPIVGGRAPPEPPPPERIVPESRPPGGRSDVADDVADGEPGGRRSERDPEASEFFSGGGRTELLGGVARTNARATQEVRVPAGRGWFGTPRRWLDGIRSARGGVVRGLLIEAPRHQRDMYPYRIDRFEVSNWRYWQYLEHAARVTYDTSDFPVRNLLEIAEALVSPAPRNLDFDITARQLFEANKGALLKVFEGRVAIDQNGVVDEEATWQAVREAVVPAGLRLRFFDRAPPSTWPRDKYADGFADHPVRDVSLEEALEFAMYEGRHVPTEYEWEHAARGPSGLDHPWGNQGRRFAERVNGGRSLARGALPRTVPVTHLPGGASWIGCFNMLGNVSEWTNGWTDLYPDGSLAPGLAAGGHLVVRGGSAADTDRLLVRPALRGWSPHDPDGAPLPGLRRRWTGLRTARYPEIGRGRLGIMQYYARRDGHIAPEAFLPYTYEALQGRKYLTHERFFDPDDPAVRPGFKAFVVNPLRTIALQMPRTQALHLPDRDHDLLTAPQLEAASAAGPILLGLLQNDLPLTNTWLGGEDGREATAKPRRHVRADCPAGTWFVAALHGQLALVGTDFLRVRYVTTRGLPAALFSVNERSSKRRETLEDALVGMRLDLDTGDLDVRLVVPLGSNQKTSDHRLHVRLRLEADPADVVRVEGWESGRLP